jgi:hypothetical protein
MSREREAYREVTAFHEAAHAVFARALGMYVKHATIKPDHESSGHVLIRWSQDHEKNLLVDMCGHIAQRIHNPNSSFGAADDARHTRDRIKAMGKSARRWSVYQAGARKLVLAHWPAISAVAAELMRVETISGRRVDALMIASARP